MYARRLGTLYLSFMCLFYLSVYATNEALCRTMQEASCIKKLFEKYVHTILVVDDSQTMRIIFKKFLQKEGYQVLEAHNGETAVEMFAQCRPDVVLMDYLMHAMDGITACRRLQSLQSGADRVPVIMITATDTQASTKEAFDAGVTDYITKPINWELLRHRLKRILAAQDSEQSLQCSTAFAESIIAHAAIGILTVDRNGCIKLANQAVAVMVGYDDKDLIECKLSLFIPEFSVSDFSNEGIFNLEVRKELSVRRKDGSFFPAWCIISPFVVGSDSFASVMISDLTESKRLENELKIQATTDALTGLLNRRQFMLRADEELRRIERYGGSCALMMIDIDRFKLINDTYGHAAGDAALKEIANILTRTLRDTDLLGRIGGEEFAVLAVELQADSCWQVGERLRKSIANSAIYIDSDKQITLTVSIGVACCLSVADSIADMMKRADAALYQAKNQGRNCVVVN